MTDRITISTEGLEALVASFGALPAQIKRAERRAVNKTLAWVNRGVKRDLAARIGTAQKILDTRVRTLPYGRNGLAAGLVFFGLNPIAITKRRFGALTQTPSGARAGRLSFPGSFAARMPSGHEAVFKRRGKKRLPIDVETITVDSAATRAIISAWADKAGGRLAEVMSQELNYQVNVRGL